MKSAPRPKTRPTSPPKLTPTALDAAAVAASIALIIGMVGSLVFFLIIAFYRGQYDGRLMYIFGLYTAATVLVARIAIESGRAYANAFSVPLAVVSILAIMRFVTTSGSLAPFSWLINVVLLAIAWFLADRITFDCTLISDRQRSLQQGLLQSLGLLKTDHVVETHSAPEDKDRALKSASESAQSSVKKRRHNPGVWVLYFALLAFPLFGLGQLAIPDDAQRGWAFTFLFSYLACALSLLVLTSLAGMRRYLRQRGVAMPAEMSMQWLSLGVGSVLLLLCVCLILPLPGRSLGLIGVPAAFQSPEALSASRWGWGTEGSENQSNAQAARAPDDQPAGAKADQPPADGPPRADGKGPPQASEQAAADAPQQPAADSARDAPSSIQTAAPNESKQPSDAAGKRGRDEAPADANQRTGTQSPRNDPSQDGPQNEPDGKQRAERQPAGDSQAEKPAAGAAEPEESSTDSAESQPAEGNSGSSPASTTSSSPSNPLSQWVPKFSLLSELFKWLTIAVLAAIVLVYALTHPAEIARLWRELLDLIAALFGRRRTIAAAAAAATPVPRPNPPRRPFSSFSDPFSADLVGWTPAQVVEHSFAALEAWAAEHGSPRKEQQTAAEFARQLAAAAPPLGPQALAAANMLDQLMFADWKPRAEDVRPLAQLWRSFSSSR